MKKTTYILLGLVALIFVMELVIGMYFYATRIPMDEYRAMHPEWYKNQPEISDDYYVEETESEETVFPQEGTTVIDASAGGYNVIISTDEKDGAVPQYYTDTLIITSKEKNILVIR